MCTKLFLGTGGGDGRSTMFESWNDAKLKKYSISVDDYDHTDVAEQPSILINNYHTHIHPYLTMIFLWDERVHFLLSSRYDPLKAGRGEAEIGNDEDDEDDNSMSGLSSAYTSANRRSPMKKTRGKRGKGAANNSGVKDTIDGLVNLVTKASSNNISPTSSSDNRKTTGLTLVDFTSLYEKHVGHLKFLKDNDMLTETRKVEILKNLEEVYAMISETHGKQRSIDNCSGNSNSTVS